jgi:hypothetical protein
MMLGIVLGIMAGVTVLLAVFCILLSLVELRNDKSPVYFMRNMGTDGSQDVQ